MYKELTDENVNTYASLVFASDLLNYMDHILNEELSGCLDAYQRLLTDWQIYSTLQQRIRAVISKEWNVTPGGKRAADKAAADFITDVISGINFDDVTEKHLYGLWYGFSVAELLYKTDGRFTGLDCIKVRDRQFFRFGVKKDLRFLAIDAPHGGIVMPENKFWVFTAGGDSHRSPYGRGLAHYCYWPATFLHGGVKAWAICQDRFAQPTPVVRLPGGKANNPTDRRTALDIIEGIQQDSGVVISDNVDLSLLEASRVGSAEYAPFAKLMEQAISKIILSQTMTTDDGSSLAQAKVHQDVADDVVKGDDDLICRSFNAGPIKWLTEFNFPGAKPPSVWRATDPGEDLSQRAERDVKIYSLGFKPTIEYITETYGEGWETRIAATPGETEPGQGPEFAESTGSKLNKLINSARANQDDLDATASLAASAVASSIVRRVQELVTGLEESGDFISFRERLTDLMLDPEADETVTDLVERVLVASRLQGATRGQGHD